MQFYVLKNNEQVGPLSLMDVRGQLQNGELAYTDMAWREGLQDWSPLSDLMGGALPEATPNAVSSTAAKVKPSAPATPRLVTSIVLFVFAFAVIGVGAWLVASFVCAVSVAAQMALAEHGGDQGTSAYIEAGQRACQNYFLVLAISAAVFSLVLSPVVAWTMAYSNLFPWCRAR